MLILCHYQTILSGILFVLVLLTVCRIIFPYLLSIFIKVLEFSVQGIQVGAARVLSAFLMMADLMQPYLFGSSFGLDDKQVWCVYIYFLVPC